MCPALEAHTGQDIFPKLNYRVERQALIPCRRYQLYPGTFLQTQQWIHEAQLIQKVSIVGIISINTCRKLMHMFLLQTALVQETPSGKRLIPDKHQLLNLQCCNTVPNVATQNRRNQNRMGTKTLIKHQGFDNAHASSNGRAPISNGAIVLIRF